MVSFLDVTNRLLHDFSAPLRMSLVGLFVDGFFRQNTKIWRFEIRKTKWCVAQRLYSYILRFLRIDSALLKVLPTPILEFYPLPRDIHIECSKQFK